MIWPYNRADDPPSPFLDLIIRHPENNDQSEQVSAKMDTGADISAIPVELVNRLGLPDASKMRVEGFDGAPTTVSTYSVTLEVMNTSFKNWEVITIPEAYVLLGRDVLNHFYVQLNGPDLTFSLSRTNTV